MNNLESVKELLPPIIIELSKLIGFPATGKLIKQLGGVQIIIAKDINNFDKFRRDLLINAIGEDNVKVLTKSYGGEVVYIPRCDKAFRELRNQSLLKDIDNLKLCDYSTCNAIALLCPTYGITTRRAWELMKRRNTSTQLPIF